MANASGNRFMDEQLREAYSFDVKLDRKATKDVPGQSQIEGYKKFWRDLETWQGHDSDKLIRLYCAETDTVAFVRDELNQNLKKYGGGYINPKVPVSSFNGIKAPDGVTLADLRDGFEYYSTDNSRILASLPLQCPRIYLQSDDQYIHNDGGFHPDETYETALQGHSWYVSRLLSHALFHSHFW
jgi:hypothetical protein